MAIELGIVLHLRRKPSEGGIVERPFGTLNTQFFSSLPGYVSSNVMDRSPKAETEACLTLQQLEQLLVRYSNPISIVRSVSFALALNPSP